MSGKRLFIEIYVLIDPRTNIVRYVGQSKNARARLGQHLGDSRRHKSNDRITNWIRKLSLDNLIPISRVIELTLDPDTSEAFWIKFYRDSGHDLCNIKDGGLRSPGAKHTEDFKKMVSDLHKGKIVPKEVGEKISRIKKGVLTKPQFCGVNCYKAKLTEDQVRLLRSKKDAKLRELAAEFNITETTASRIRRHLCYKYVF